MDVAFGRVDVLPNGAARARRSPAAKPILGYTRSFREYVPGRGLFNGGWLGGAWLGALLLVALLILGLPAQAAGPVRILAFGDSLTAGYGLPSEAAFPARLEKALEGKGLDVTVDNAGVSGDTTAGGLARLDWALTGSKPQLAIVALGANDGLRGLDPAATRANLDAILTRLEEAGVTVLLAGMYAPPNLGSEYSRDFNAIFPELAKQHDVALYPFFLDGVAAEPSLNQADGIHPNADGVDQMVRGILPHVLRLMNHDG